MTYSWVLNYWGHWRECYFNLWERKNGVNWALGEVVSSRAQGGQCEQWLKAEGWVHTPRDEHLLSGWPSEACICRQACLLCGPSAWGRALGREELALQADALTREILQNAGKCSLPQRESFVFLLKCKWSLGNFTHWWFINRHLHFWWTSLKKKNQQLIESKNKTSNSPWVREGEERGLGCRKVETRTLKMEGEIDKGKLTFGNTVFPLHCPWVP